MDSVAHRVLIVEDSPVFRKVLCRALSEEGYGVETAGNGIEAWQQLEREKFDLLLLDVEMPQCDGLRLLHILKELPTWKDLKIIMLTSVVKRETILEALRSGACDYVLKKEHLVEQVLQRMRRQFGVEEMVAEAI